MNYVRIIWKSLRQDPDSFWLVLLLTVAMALNAIDGQWWVALAFFVLTVSGVRHAMEYPHINLGRTVSDASRKYEEVAVIREGDAVRVVGRRSIKDAP